MKYTRLQFVISCLLHLRPFWPLSFVQVTMSSGNSASSIESDGYLLLGARIGLIAENVVKSTKAKSSSEAIVNLGLCDQIYRWSEWHSDE